MAGDNRAYHHGDLRSALLDAGLALTREGGTGALTLREVTRSVGVTPSAAYRHFADLRSLLFATAALVQAKLASSIRSAKERETTAADAADRSLQALRGVGLGYIEFAITEPGWFELAIMTHDQSTDAPVRVEGHVPDAFALLLGALDEMVETGALAPERREHAEWACWSSVHGFADLATRGPLSTQPRPVLDALSTVVVDTVIAGLR